MKKKIVTNVPHRILITIIQLLNKQITSNKIIKKYQKTYKRNSSMKVAMELSIGNNAKPSLIKIGKKITKKLNYKKD